MSQPGPSGSALAPGLHSIFCDCRQQARGTAPQARQGEEWKTPSDSVEYGPHAEGLGSRRGAKSSRQSPRLWPSRHQCVRQSRKGQMLRWRVESVASLVLRWQKGGGAAGRRTGQAQPGWPGPRRPEQGKGGHSAPRHSLPLHSQHQRVTARHCHHREGHMWVSAGGTGRE